MTTNQSSSDSDQESCSSSTPQPPPSSPPKSPFRRPIFSAVSAVKTHMNVVRAAITHNKPNSNQAKNKTPPGGNSGVSAAKEGELYPWEGDETPVAKGNKRLVSNNNNILQPALPLLDQPQLAGEDEEQKIGDSNVHIGSHYTKQISQISAMSAATPFSQISPVSIDSSTAAVTSIAPGAASPEGSSSQQLQQQQQQQQHKSQTPPPIPNLQASWSWSEQLFFSQDDESVSTATPIHTPTQRNATGGVGAGPALRHQNTSCPNVTSVNSVNLGPILEVGDDDDATCNNTIVEKVRQRSKKASRASTVGAFVTFLKALFGIGMLSNPAVLGEVGLLLGTFCHLFIVVGCAFACYLLLAARQMAKMEVMAKQRRDAEKKEDYEMWRAEMERRAAQRAGRRESQSLPRLNNGYPTTTDRPTTKFPGASMQRQSVASTLGELNPLDHSQGSSSNRTIRAANTDTCDSNEEDWTVTPVPLNIPLNRVGTSGIPAKEGWVRCENALSNSVGRARGNPTSGNRDGNLTTGSCGNVQVIREPHHSKSEGNLNGDGFGRSGSKDRLQSRSEEPPRNTKLPRKVASESRRFSESIHSNYMMMPPPPPEPPAPPNGKPAQVRLVTYGDVAKYLAGKRASFFIIFTIVTVHLMFASGMVHLAVENLCYVVGWERLGWSYVEEYVEQEQGQGNSNRHRLMRRLGSGMGQQIGYEIMRRLGPSDDEDDNEGSSADNRNNNYASRSSDEEEYYLEWKGPDFIGRLAMSALLFPIIQGLLQIPSLTELATISTVGLVTYAVGCIGSMLYTAVVLTDGHPFMDHPDDMWKTKWSGIPTYVATTIYCIEGINLALPTVSSIEGVQRWGGGSLMRQSTSQLSDRGAPGSSARQESDRQDLSVFIVVGAVFLYGMVTLVVSWLGLAGGLGGGIGTIHGEDGCWDVTYCLNSSAVRFVYMLSLGIALILTLPVILYPSTEMLEVWLDERNDERRRQREQMLASALAPGGEGQPPKKPFWDKQKSLLPDDETVYTVNDTLTPRPLGIRQGDIEMRDLNCNTSSAGDYVAPSCTASSPSDTTSVTYNQEGESPNPATSPNSNITPNNHSCPPTGGAPENTKLKAKRKLKYWKLRMFLAFIICVIGTIEGSFPSVLKAAEVIRGVGLSIAGLIFPPLLYMSAVGGNFSVPMAAAMALLIGLGLFNIVLVLMSAFGAKDFIVEEGRGNFYEM